MDLQEEQLRNSKTIAVVGLSDNPDRDSHRVSKYMQSQGYRIIPVNPMIEEALGEKSYPDLKSVPENIDMVDVFRRSELVRVAGIPFRYLKHFQKSSFLHCIL